MTKACPVCDALAQRTHSFDDVVLYRCRRCSHRFTDVASLEYLGEYDDAWEALHTNWFENPNIALFELIRRTIEEHKPDATVVDIGAGRGELLEYLRRASPRLSLTGIDLSLEPNVDGVELLRGDITALDVAERRWDVAVSLATIEHVADVKAFAARLRDLLVPGGLAIVMTIDDSSVLYRTARMMRTLGYDIPARRLYDRHHLNHFSGRSLQTLLQRCGLRPLAVHRHNVPLAAVDMPTDSRLLKLGVAATFALGRLTRRTYLQTVVATP